MPLPRVQAFEFNDRHDVSTALRDTIVESLGRMLRWGRILRGVVVPFEEFLALSGAREVLDLCAGAGAPATILVGEMKAAGRTPPPFLLTDLFPLVTEWKQAQATFPDTISFVPEPVDATAIPEAVSKGRVRVIVNAFHHFPPALAKAILSDAVRGSEGIFISEPFPRNPLRFLTQTPAGLPALLINPILTPRDRLAKVLLTWLTPIAILASVWDGVVSTLRIYTEADLRAMVAPLGDSFEWHFRKYHYAPLGEGYCFFGVKRR